ncbi:MAG: hypothetical protein F4X00_03680, partial [Gemmatimonadetes bacterium]|nr:hypothetical protein [Gemmatimonadota bacterium]
PDPNQAPQPTGTIPSLEVAQGDSATVDLAGYFRDPDGDPLTFAAMSSDPGIAAPAVTGSLVIVRALSRGTATVTMTATDPGGLSARQTFEVSVPNRGPEAVGAIEDIRLEVGDSVRIGVAARFTDPEGDPLAFAAASSDTLAARAEVDGDSVLIVAAAKGEVTVTVTARDPGGETAGQSFNVTVPNRAPFVAETIPGDTVLLGDTAEVRLTTYFEDPDGDSLAFSAVSSAPGVATVRVSGRTLVVVPEAPGSTTITVTSADPEGLSAAQSFEVTAAHPNRAPAAVGEISDRVIYVGNTDSLDVSTYFSDPDGDSLVYTATTSRRIRVTVAVHGSGIALAAQSIGSSTIAVTAHDPDGLSATQRFRAVVEPVPAPDLVVDTPMVDRDSVEVGGEFTLGVIVRNLGNAEAQSRNTLRFYESFDSRITSSDREVGTDSVMPLAAGQASEEASVLLTAGPLVGIRFFGACVDAPPNETSTRNNCSAGVPVVFWQPNRPPLPRDSIRAPTLEPGDTFRTRLGRFFFDPDRDSLRYAAESSDASIATASVSSDLLTVEAKATGTATITVTARDVTTRRPGSFAATQRFDVRVTLRPRPDLVVDMAQDSFSINPQRTFLINAVVRNEGTREVSSGTTVRFFLSSDSTIGTADTEVGTDTLGALPESGRQLISVSLTSSAAEGVYYYGACVDSVEEESSTDNNCSGALVVVVDEERPPNRPPRVEKTFRDVTDAIPGQRYRAPLLEIFSDPDDDPLTITATSSDESVVRTEIVADSIQLYTIDVGSVIITVTATDPAGLSASTEFSVTVRAPTPPSSGFSIRFLVQTTVPEAQRAPIRAAVGAWEAVLAETELPDVVVPEGFDCAGLTLSRQVVDDHMFIALVLPIDGPGGTLARAGFCAQRSGGGFPAVSRAVFDAGDIDELLAEGMLTDVAFHEIAHGLGYIHGRFNSLGLLNTDADPHFTGSGARAAFDAAGGTSYTGAKVPLSSPDYSHWREEVFDVEMMTPRIEVGVPQPVSAITLAAMADLGYSVNLDLADSYTLPGARAPLAARGPRRTIDLSDDVMQGPVTILGPDGGIVDVIPPPAGYDPIVRAQHRVTLDLRSRGGVGQSRRSHSPLDPVARDASNAVSWIVETYPALRPEAPSRRPR